MILTQVFTRDSVRPIGYELITFHDITMRLVIFIITYVGVARFIIISPTYSVKSSYEDHELEAAWTAAPALSLILLALPSIRLLYIIEENFDSLITIKRTGYQWYWSYDYLAYSPLEYDSYLENNSLEGRLHILDTDNRVVIPWGIEVRIMVTSEDVIHSWALPSLRRKADAIPGRLNQLTLYSRKPGIFHGQCSEICGVGHSFIPIQVEFIKPLDWWEWITASLLLNN